MSFAAQAGTAPALAETVVGEFRWQGRRLRASAPTPAGKRKAEVPMRRTAAGAVLPMGEAGTIWYELVPE